MTEKLYQELDQVGIKQTISPIRFKDEAINKIQRKNINFGKRSYIFIPFIVSKDSHQKGLKLRVCKGSISEKNLNLISNNIKYLIYFDKNIYNHKIKS